MHRRRLVLLALWVLTLSCKFMVAHASAGDMDSTFRTCTAHCESTGCVSLNTLTPDQTQCFAACPKLNGLQVPLALQAFHWTCRDDCRYHDTEYCCVSKVVLFALNYHMETVS